MDGEKTRSTSGGMVNDSESRSAEMRLEFIVTNANLEATIQSLVQVIEQDEVQTAENKRTVNRLCAKAGKPPIYPDADRAAGGAQLGGIRPDEYYGQPLASAIRMILEARKASGLGAATVREIYEALIKGGFRFEAKDENAVRGLRQSLSKNSVTFHKLPNGTYGLLEWYPGAKAARPGEDDDD